jgi:predicted outer membrane lipoprotein
MSEPATLGFPEAARRLGVALWVLRRAIRTGRLPAPPHATATATIPAAWLEHVEAAVKDKPELLSRSFQQKVPAFARYEGTSAFRKYGHRVREYAHFKARKRAEAATA